MDSIYSISHLHIDTNIEKTLSNSVLTHFDFDNFCNYSYVMLKIRFYVPFFARDIIDNNYCLCNGIPEHTFCKNFKSRFENIRLSVSFNA